MIWAKIWRNEILDLGDAHGDPPLFTRGGQTWGFLPDGITSLASERGYLLLSTCPAWGNDPQMETLPAAFKPPQTARAKRAASPM